MVAPLIGAGIRAASAAARGLVKKFGKKTAKEKAEEKAEREAKGKIQKEAIELDREVEEIGNKAYRSLYPKKDKLDGPTAAMACNLWLVYLLSWQAQPLIVLRRFTMKIN
jgi:hypothetical protein